MVWRYQRSNQHPKSKKDIQHNDQKKRDKRKNNDIQNTSNSQNKRDKQWWTKQSAYNLRCSDVNYGCCIMKWTYFRVIIRSVKDFFLLLNVILNTISIIYIFPEYPVKTNCHEQTFLCTTISTKIAYIIEVLIGSDCTGRCKSKLTTTAKQQ